MKMQHSVLALWHSVHRAPSTEAALEPGDSAERAQSRVIQEAPESPFLVPGGLQIMTTPLSASLTKRRCLSPTPPTFEPRLPLMFICFGQQNVAKVDLKKF